MSASNTTASGEPIGTMVLSNKRRRVDTVSDTRSSPALTTSLTDTTTSASDETVLETSAPEETPLVANSKYKSRDWPAEVNQPISEDVVCAICQEVMAVAHTIDCGHSFCGICIKKWKDFKKPCLCPTCRKRFKTMVPSHVIDRVIAHLISQNYLNEEEKQDLEQRKQKWADVAAMDTQSTPEDDRAVSNSDEESSDSDWHDDSDDSFTSDLSGSPLDAFGGFNLLAQMMGAAYLAHPPGSAGDYFMGFPSLDYYSLPSSGSDVSYGEDSEEEEPRLARNQANNQARNRGNNGRNSNGNSTHARVVGRSSTIPRGDNAGPLSGNRRGRGSRRGAQQQRGHSSRGGSRQSNRGTNAATTSSSNTGGASRRRSGITLAGSQSNRGGGSSSNSRRGGATRGRPNRT